MLRARATEPQGATQAMAKANVMGRGQYHGGALRTMGILAAGPYIESMAWKSLALLLALSAGPAAGQCVTGGPAAALVVTCPGGVGVLTTDRLGTVTGMIGGKSFVGSQISPGIVTGTLDGAPFSTVGGVTPAPPPSMPVPGVDLASPGLAPPLISPSQVEAPPPIVRDGGVKAATRRRVEHLRRLREAEAAAKAPTPRADAEAGSLHAADR